MYAVQGPKSKDLLNTFLTESIDDLKFFTIRDNSIDGFRLRSPEAATPDLGIHANT
jgi:glycine cleavage system aminomethyltransferase T